MKNNKAFTIVELLIVVVVIAILAAVTIVGFNGVRNQTERSSLESDASSVAKQLEMYKIRNDRYPDNLNSIEKDEKYKYQYTRYSSPESFCATLQDTQEKLFHFTGHNLNLQDGACEGHVGAVAEPLITLGDNHACAVLDGVAKCWGRNNKGQLGAGNVGATSSVPVEVDTSGVLAGKTITAISAGYEFTCAVADGSPYCWGATEDGRLGNNESSSSLSHNTPVAVDTSGVLSGKTVTDIATGSFHTCVMADGAPYCWGSGQYGRLGNGSTSQRSYPVAVTTSGVLSSKTISKLVSNLYGSCVVADSSSYCWGRVRGYTESTPIVAINNNGSMMGLDVMDIDLSGGDGTCAMSSDYGIHCRGGGQYGRIGDGLNTTQNTTVQADSSGDLSGKALKGFVYTRSSSHCVLDVEDNLYCWGWNSYGKSGNGSTEHLLVPTRINNSALSSGRLQAISGNTNSMCAVVNDAPYCWGMGQYGVLGNGVESNSLLPVQVSW